MRMIAVSEWISLSEHRWVNLAERYSHGHRKVPQAGTVLPESLRA